jgi:hypothetical protein
LGMARTSNGHASQSDGGFPGRDSNKDMKSRSVFI